MSSAASTFTEKEFFLRAFHGVTLALAVSPTGDGQEAGAAELATVLRQLQGHHVRAVLFYRQQSEAEALLRRRLAGLAPAWLLLPEGEEAALLSLWREEHPLLVVGVTAAAEPDFVTRVGAVARALRFPRLVIADGVGGGLTLAGRVAGFLSARRLARRLAAGQVDEARRWLLTLIHYLLEEGVEAVSLCRLVDLGQELFTYEGQGAFFSQRRYCVVQPLGFNHFAEVESLIRRGEREGYLLPRDDRQLLTVLTNGYGAFIAGRHLAGVCALLTEPYRDEQAGEVVALYTITRYLGEGVGGQLLHWIKREGRRRGLQSLFACTTSDHAVRFFQRHGFRPVAQEQTPAAKWRGYDPARRARTRCVRLDW